uniref:Uncharacterized protein n=1 Tax=Anguilla anguilla TaxID=7936 RepID=A0A0E9T636_ANGAN
MTSTCPLFKLATPRDWPESKVSRALGSWMYAIVVIG